MMHYMAYYFGLFVPRQLMLLVNRLKINISFRECSLKIALTRSIFSPKYTKYRLVAGIHPDPLGKLTALPQTSTWIYGAYF